VDETSRANGSRYGGIVSTWLGQGNAISAGKPTFREIDLKLRKIGAFVYVTDELLADADALDSWVNRYLPLELTFRAEDAILNGVGGNQPLGIFNSGAVVTVSRTVASHVNFEDIVAMWSRMYAPSRQNAVWLIDQSVEVDLYKMSFAVGTGGVPVFMPANGISGQPFATLFGRPIIPVEYCANLGTSGDLVLADFSEYTVIDKGGVDAAVSMHVAFLTDEQVFRFMYRVDGQPNWNSALTPKSAGNTLSPYVILN
jgi:HK97 family phage major capsid protein